MVDHFIDLKSFAPGYLEDIVERALAVKRNPGDFSGALAGRKMYMLFQKTSTRTALSFAFGMLAGGISGYFGGKVDTVMMRTTELIMSITALYLILAMRAAMPVDIPSDKMYLIIVVILSFIGWASMSRIIRGMVLSIKENDYVTAARALGYGHLRIIVRHILPNTLSFVIVAATISVPGYILGEVALSFLGVGIAEPVASWGNMLKQAQSVRVLTSFPWILAPGFAIFITVLAFNFLGDGLRDALDPRKIMTSN